MQGASLSCLLLFLCHPYIPHSIIQIFVVSFLFLWHYVPPKQSGLGYMMKRHNLWIHRGGLIIFPEVATKTMWCTSAPSCIAMSYFELQGLKLNNNNDENNCKNVSYFRFQTELLWWFFLIDSAGPAPSLYTVLGDIYLSGHCTYFF